MNEVENFIRLDTSKTSTTLESSVSWANQLAILIHDGANILEGLAVECNGLSLNLGVEFEGIKTSLGKTPLGNYRKIGFLKPSESSSKRSVDFLIIQRVKIIDEIKQCIEKLLGLKKYLENNYENQSKENRRALLLEQARSLNANSLFEWLLLNEKVYLVTDIPTEILPECMKGVPKKTFSSSKGGYDSWRDRTID